MLRVVSSSSCSELYAQVCTHSCMPKLISTLKLRIVFSLGLRSCSHSCSCSEPTSYIRAFRLTHTKPYTCTHAYDTHIMIPIRLNRTPHLLQVLTPWPTPTFTFYPPGLVFDGMTPYHVRSSSSCMSADELATFLAAPSCSLSHP